MMIDVVVAAVVAGILMAVAADAVYRAGIAQGNLLRVDGEFAFNMIGIQASDRRIYMAGFAIHLITSAAFGIILFAFGRITDADITGPHIVVPYVFILWLAMLFAALPIAGQGLAGRKLGPATWMEQLVLHIVFGIGLWGMLGILD